MSVEGKGGGVSRSSDKTKESRNTKGESEKSLKLANAKERKKGAKVSRTCQLLQVIH